MVDNVGDRVIISKKRHPLSAINMYGFMWLVYREICLAFLLCQQTKKFGKHCPRHYFLELPTTQKHELQI